MPPPPGTKRLLGKGLKFCVKYPVPTNDVNASLKRFENDVRRIVTFLGKEDDNNYIPELYIKSGWPFDEVDDEIEDALSKFRAEVEKRQRRYRRRRSTNLTPLQWHLMRELKKNDYYIVIEADKNLGACILRLSIYTERGIKEHLGDTSVYKRLSAQEAHGKMQALKYQYRVFINRFRDYISAAETTFLERALKTYPNKYARFRMSLKAHKKPWKMRPIVCCAGTFMNCLSKWLNYQLQKLKRFVPSYLKDSGELLKDLQALGRLPPTARLFTADANSMYTCIDTEHAIAVISNWIDGLPLTEENGLNDFPIDAVKSAMGLVMRNNLFEWGDLYFLQLTGTAMGTSAACMWATIYFAIREEFLLGKYSSELLLYKRFIDDMFAIWLGSNERWIEFKADTNNFGILTWDFDDNLSASVNFLDLTITINSEYRIQTKTYQKEMNLYQYIPPTSAHPPKMMKGIVYGLIRQYKLQNTLPSDYINQSKLLFQRLVARGWDKRLIKSYILDADAKLSNPTTNPSTNNTETLTNKEQLFLHWKYHPHDIPRKNLRQIYDETCKDIFEGIGIKKLTIAYSRAPNLSSELTRAKLHQAPGKEASKYYDGELTN